MADVNQSIESLRETLERIPLSSQDRYQSETIRVYLSLLKHFTRYAGQGFRNVQASGLLERETMAAEAAEKRTDWSGVLQHAYASIVSLPGDTGWTPIRDIPPPK